MKTTMVTGLCGRGAALLLMCGLWSCTNDSESGIEAVDPDVSLPSDTEAADQESAAEEAASEITEENADSTLEELERALEEAEKDSGQG
jgi:hypothetical protein